MYDDGAANLLPLNANELWHSTIVPFAVHILDQNPWNSCKFAFLKLDKSVCYVA